MTLPARRRETNPFLAKQLDRLNRYNEFLDLADEAQDRLNTLQQVEPLPAEFNPLQTGRISDEWVDAVLDHTERVARQDLLFRTLSELRRDANANAKSIYLNNTDTMLAGLHDDLQDMLREVDALAADLDGADTAQAALAADKGTAWRRLTALVDDYRTLRLAQSSLMSNHMDYVTSARPAAGGEEPASDLHIANLDDLWPNWSKPGGPQRINVDGGKHRYEPWPTDPVQFLLWLATSNAEAWIPTRRELDSLNHERLQKANPNPTTVNGIITDKKYLNRTPAPVEIRQYRTVSPITAQ